MESYHFERREEEERRSMLAVPEVDDDLGSSSSPETIQVPDTEEEKATLNSPTLSPEQHRSRLSHFHRSGEATT